MCSVVTYNHKVLICLSEHLFNYYQAVIQMQESLQQQVQQVSSLLEEADHNLPTSLIHQATQLQVCKLELVTPGSGVYTAK